MKRRSFLQNKLWRDKAVEMLEATGSVIHWRRLEDEEYREELKLKLLEEASEVASAKTKEEIKAELADLLEVIECICRVEGLSMEEIALAKEKKQAERGGFNQRKYVTIAEHVDASFGAEYCLATPEKYPEIL